MIAGADMGELAELACILEVTARKPGNVHPGVTFEDTTFLDFLISAAAIRPALENAPRAPLGETILDAVARTRRRVARNTNLGLILALTPLAALGPREPRDGDVKPHGAAHDRIAGRLHALLAATTRRDAELLYEAIRLAQPGGLGRVERADVGDGPTGTLVEMMALAADRDLIARQYATSYRAVLDDGLPAFVAARSRGADVEEATISAYLQLLAEHGDTLIERKCGEKIAAEARERAARVLAAGWPRSAAGRRELHELDLWLRADGNRRNPGTCADLTAAVLFLALREGIITFPLESQPPTED